MIDLSVTSSVVLFVSVLLMSRLVSCACLSVLHMVRLEVEWLACVCGWSVQLTSGC